MHSVGSIMLSVTLELFGCSIFCSAKYKPLGIPKAGLQTYEYRKVGAFRCALQPTPTWYMTMNASLGPRFKKLF